MRTLRYPRKEKKKGGSFSRYNRQKKGGDLLGREERRPDCAELSIKGEKKPSRQTSGEKKKHTVSAQDGLLRNSKKVTMQPLPFSWGGGKKKDQRHCFDTPAKEEKEVPLP